MCKITANDTKSNFDEELEALKTDYIKHCFENAKEDLERNDVIDGEAFLNSL